ncbi:biotin synthase-related enzyme [Desulfosporosinus orientis DSM 765]|uniref:Biotin synthase-related enzyme n=1 Tax=Desulfosporosinus orientis (strain ATCC 19365 / DSM 765 / NCIMB 8382 / VKM B-1628 / Singapore I) TaxID=768706 RepID=G7WJ94_DESOD|nr:radical SAM protein [Desulfosporosinus orientis]AET69753.1 biotin synthase-related enzyme [Desulfosporosinus orientis DSM 765]
MSNTHACSQSESPEVIQTSLAAAMTLGLKGGIFYRDAKLTCLNLLLTYQEGCQGRCAYCGLEQKRSEKTKGTTFIRVAWPTYSFDLILERTKQYQNSLQRICLSMITHKRAMEDSLNLIARLHREVNLPISILCAPTLIHKTEDLHKLKEAGADQLGVSIDTATAEIFEKYRGKGVRGPHRWEHYWEILSKGVAVFGQGQVSAHLIVGLGESEREMVMAFQRIHDLGAVAHLFSFYPEPGSALAEKAAPSLGQYRRMQLARFLIMNDMASAEIMGFNSFEQVYDFGINVEPFVASGQPFRTSGCPGKDGETACNRPYGNERPGIILANYPFAPNRQDVEQIRGELYAGLMEGVEQFEFEG